MTNSRTMRVLQAAAGMVVLAAGWQILSYVFPHYLFPPVPEIISRTIEVLITGSLLVDVLLTAGRIFGGLFGAFILGSILALVIGQSKTAETLSRSTSCRSRSARARSSPCWARPAAASRPCSISSPG